MNYFSGNAVSSRFLRCAPYNQYDKNLEKMEKDMKDRIVTIETGYGVQNVVIRILYRNGDGSIITEKYFTR